MAGFTRSVTSENTSDGLFPRTDMVLEQLKEGDEAVFVEVYQLYREMVYTVALRLLADKAESMDVTQEVFLTLFRKVRSFRGDCSLKTWLYRVTLNEAANRNRWWNRPFRRATVALEFPSDGERPSHPEIACNTPSPARECLSNELREAVTRGLRKLPFEQRAAVVLRDVEGLSYEEIAEVVGANPGTVKSRIARGREQLREVLREFQGGDQL